MRVPPGLLPLLPLLLLASCDASQRTTSDAPFTFAMVTSDTLDVEVRAAAGPVEGALVYVRPETGGPPLWQGVTAGDGHARGKIVHESSTTRMAVVVQHPDFVGPWSAPQPRDTFGPFAPTSWEVLEAGALAAHVVAVEVRR